MKKLKLQWKGIYAAHADSYRTDRSRRSHDAVLHQGQEIWHS